MTAQANTLTVDHRHPDLVAVCFRLVQTAEHAAAKSELTTRDAVDVAVAALGGAEDGEHHEVASRALADASGLGPDVLRDVWASPITEDRPTCVKELACRWPGLDSEALVDAVVRLETCHHIRLIYTFANRLASRYERVAEELFQDAYLGLTKALLSYVPSAGTISTFAHHRIRGSIQDGIRAESPVPKRLTTFVRKVESVEDKLTHSLSRPPTKDEVEKALGENARYLHLYPRLAPQVSLDERLEVFEQPADVDTCDLVLQQETRETLQDALEALPWHLQQAVQLLVLDELSPRDASRLTGITQKSLQARAEEGLLLLRENRQVRQLAPAAA